MPAIVEADDSGLYVLKFLGAGQGVRALVAELIAGELARSLGLLVPELVLIDVDAALGRNEPDTEIRELIKKSVGQNVALDYLPGSLTFDPVVGPSPSAEVASRIVWFDAWVTNVDRTAKNPNLLTWHKELYLIDHGASFYFHHADDAPQVAAQNVFATIRSHVLLPWASALEAAETFAHKRLTLDVIARAVSELPDIWLETPERTAAQWRQYYVTFLVERLKVSSLFTQEALSARARLL